MTIDPPQLLLLCLLLFCLGHKAREHGLPRRGDHSIWPTLAAIVALNGVLWLGGWYEPH